MLALSESVNRVSGRPSKAKILLSTLWRKQALSNFRSLVTCNPQVKILIQVQVKRYRDHSLHTNTNIHASVSYPCFLDWVMLSYLICPLITRIHHTSHPCRTTWPMLQNFRPTDGNSPAHFVIYITSSKLAVSMRPSITLSGWVIQHQVVGER